MQEVGIQEKRGAGCCASFPRHARSVEPQPGAFFHEVILRATGELVLQTRDGSGECFTLSGNGSLHSHQGPLRRVFDPSDYRLEEEFRFFAVRKIDG
jgi:hypothetical protein